MTDIRDIDQTSGPRIVDNAQKLRDANVITDDQMKTLTDNRVDEKDLEIGRQAQAKLNPSEHNVPELMNAIKEMNQDFRQIQRKQLDSILQEFPRASKHPPNDVLPAFLRNDGEKPKPNPNVISTAIEG